MTGGHGVGGRGDDAHLMVMGMMMGILIGIGVGMLMRHQRVPGPNHTMWVVVLLLVGLMMVECVLLMVAEAVTTVMTASESLVNVLGGRWTNHHHPARIVT